MHDSYAGTASRRDTSPSTCRPKIAVVIPRGEVIRNFVYSGTLDRLSEEAELTLISVMSDSSIMRSYAESLGPILPLSETGEPWLVRFQREILDMAHGRWLWSQAARERWRIRDAEAIGPKKKVFRATKKAVCYPFSNRVGLRALSGMERFSSRVLSPCEEYGDLMGRTRPDLVFNGSHIHSRNATQAIQAAQWLGIKTATFIFSWDNLTSQGRILLPYDYYLVWNDDVKRQLLDIYEWIRPEQVIVTGTPQFDLHFRAEAAQTREEYCRSIGADPERPLVLYTTGMSNHMPGEPEIVEEVADMLAAMDGGPSPQLLVRVYPKDRSGRFDELKSRRKDILFPEVAWEKEWLTPRPEDSEALANTLRHCDLGINIASTVTLELCMFDKPVINVGYNPLSVQKEHVDYSRYYDFDHYAPVVKSGAIEIAWDREQMRGLLGRALQDPKRLSDPRRRLIEQMFGDTLDGRSSRRVADALISIVKRAIEEC